MVAGIQKHFDIYINKRWKWKQSQNVNSKPVYVGTKSVVYLSIAWKNTVFTINIHHLWKGTDFEGVIL